LQKLEESRKEIVDKIIKLKRQILNESANDFS